MRAKVDEEVCQGHGVCRMIAPEVFGARDSDGHAIVLIEGDLDSGDLEDAQMAEAGCPEYAISLNEGPSS